MIDRRRCPNPTRRCGSTHTPAPSGPRCATASRSRTMYSGVTSNGEPVKLNAPTMPHIGLLVELAAEQQVLYLEREGRRLDDFVERDGRVAAHQRPREGRDFVGVTLVGLAAVPQHGAVARAGQAL